MAVDFLRSGVEPMATSRWVHIPTGVTPDTDPMSPWTPCLHKRGAALSQLEQLGLRGASKPSDSSCAGPRPERAVPCAGLERLCHKQWA